MNKRDIRLKKNAYIISLKFAPGLLKEFFLLGEKLEEKDLNVKYILASEYKRLIGKSNKNLTYLGYSHNLKSIVKVTIKYLFAKKYLIEIFEEDTPDFICLYNPHLLNQLVFFICRIINPNCIRLVFLHEPYKPDKKSFGFFGILHYHFVEILQRFILKDATDVILPSKYAMNLYLSKFRKTEKPRIHKAHILLKETEFTGETKIKREYLSFIGNIDKSRGLNEFLSLIKYLNNLKEDKIKFKIITRSFINDKLRKLTLDELSLLEIVNKSQITDKEIEAVLLESFAVFLSHKQVTQSGCIPLAFKFGTPVIARNLQGFSQHIEHKVEGYLLPKDFSVEDFYLACKYIKNNFEMMSVAAKKRFRELFSEVNWGKNYSWLAKNYYREERMHNNLNNKRIKNN